MAIRIDSSREVYRSDERLPTPDPWVRQLAHLMDDGIRIGSFSIGLDPLLGLMPGIGDLLGAMISMLIVARAVQAGIPRVAVARMLANIAIDTLVGSIPLLGDAFDFGWKANLKNVQIYEQALSRGRAVTARHWGWFLGLILLVGSTVAAILVGVFALARRAF
jgi:hypothetical protein